MQPMKPSSKKAILEANPQAAPEEVEEYERLLSQRFTVEPGPQAAPGSARAAAIDQNEARLRFLYEKLFSKKGE